MDQRVDGIGRDDVGRRATSTISSAIGASRHIRRYETLVDVTNLLNSLSDILVHPGELLVRVVERVKIR